MADEKLLINANEPIKKLEEHRNLFIDAWQGFAYLSDSDKARVDEIDTCIAEIINATTVDAVEVVRCKECKSYDPGYIRRDHGCGRERQQAIYRLGQMDMREAAAQMLLDLSDGTQGVVCATLIDAAQRVRDLKLCDAIKENADGDT